MKLEINTLENMTKRWVSILGFLDNPKRGKRKNLEKRHGETNKERREEFQLHRQEGQDFSAAGAAAHLITHKSGES